MVKNLKLKIKNTQIAQALKKTDKKSASKPKSAARKKPIRPVIDKALDKEKEASKRPKARIVQHPKAKTEETKEQPKEEVKDQAAPKTPPKAAKAEKKPAEEKPKVEVEKPKKEAAKEKAKEEPKKVVEKKEKPVEKLVIKEKAEPKPKETAKEKPKEKVFEKETPKKTKEGSFKQFRDFRAARKKESGRGFDARDRRGLRAGEEEGWRRRRHHKVKRQVPEELIVRPKNLKVRIPITIKELAQEMKLKASELISKLFMQGVVLTLNDYLDDETTIQLLGQEFECEITIDTSEEERLQITGKSIREEIQETPAEKLEFRPPVITFMGHVDHGKTSLIDAIRKSELTALEAGAITQHIGAFVVKTPSGKITILDTPGHEAFSEMRERGANVTDLVVLVIAGDEGLRDQTLEAIKKAQEANVPMVVAINKSDKENFDEQKVFRQLADNELLPEAWGGTLITVNCSASSGAGISDLLEMIALQSEVLELKANPDTRARGTTLESQMHKGLGAVATVLIQNGTLRKGDAIVFGDEFGRIKTMHDEHNNPLKTAGPSTPVKITGLSSLAEAGSEFIVVKDEKEARALAHARAEGTERRLLKQPKTAKLEGFLQQSKEQAEVKILPVILRADVQGSLEALKNSLLKIPSKKARVEIVNEAVGEVSESDIDLAAASKAVIIGFHTRIESRAESLIKQKKVEIRLHDVIYHAVDDVKELMRGLLDKIAEEKDAGTALVKATFKSSQLGTIAGCIVTDGSVKRNNHVRLVRDKEEIWKGKIASLKRVKEDVKEVQKGMECGILLDGFQDFKEGDSIQAFEITYREQKLS